jgi:hypothetical protein
MAVEILEVFGTVRPDGTLELDQKLNVPAGRVRVRVEAVTPAPPVTESLVEFGERSRRELEAAGHRFRTKEEIDAEIEELRNDWDDPIDDLNRGTGQLPEEEKPAC